MIHFPLKHDLKPSIIKNKLQKLDPENLVDLKVVQNDAYLHDNKIKPAKSSNMTDDIHNIISSIYQNPFIKSVGKMYHTLKVLNHALVRQQW
jgi:hypothetical protein